MHSHAYTHARTDIHSRTHTRTLNKAYGHNDFQIALILRSWPLISFFVLFNLFFFIQDATGNKDTLFTAKRFHASLAQLIDINIAT